MSAKFCFLGDDVTAEASTAMAARGAREALGTAEKPKKELATEGQDFDHDAYYAEAPVASGVGHRYPRARAAVFWMATYSPAARPKREHPPRLAESTLDSSNCSDVYGNARRGFRSNSGPPAKRGCTCSHLQPRRVASVRGHPVAQRRRTVSSAARPSVQPGRPSGLPSALHLPYEPFGPTGPKKIR